MRLEPHEIEAIRKAARDVFGENVIVRVFGSRVHDHMKGGDLDLHLEVEPGQATLDNEAAFLWLIERPLDELKTVPRAARARHAAPADRRGRARAGTDHLSDPSSARVRLSRA